MILKFSLDFQSSALLFIFPFNRMTPRFYPLKRQLDRFRLGSAILVLKALIRLDHSFYAGNGDLYLYCLEKVDR